MKEGSIDECWVERIMRECRMDQAWARCVLLVIVMDEDPIEEEEIWRPFLEGGED